MRKTTPRHPILMSIAVLLIFFVSMLLGSVFIGFAPPFFRQNGELLMQSVGESVVCLAGILCAAAFGYIRAFYNTDKFGTGVACSAYLLIAYAFSGVASLALEFEEHGSGVFDRLQPFGRIMVWPLAVLLIGFAEETFFRGVVANLFFDKHGKDPAGVRTAAIYSGIMFGAVHLTNMVSSEPSGVLVQVASVTCIGIAMAAIYYRCRNIWVMILLHAFMDFCACATIGLFGGSLSSEISDYSIVSTITAGLPYLIVAAVLLRKKKVCEVLCSDPNVAVTAPQISPGETVISMDMRSSPESKKSFRRAIIVFILFEAVCIAGSFLLTDNFRDMVDDLTGATVLEYDTEEVYTSEDRTARGTELDFEVDRGGDYKVVLITEPSDSNVNMVLRIEKDGETVYESAYGGKCTDTFGVELGEGTYRLYLVYDFSGIKKEPVDYRTSVKITAD